MRYQKEKYTIHTRGSNKIILGNTESSNIYAKYQLIDSYYQNPNNNIYVITYDQSESYNLLAKNLNGTFVNLSQNVYINPLDLDLRYFTKYQ